MTAAAPEQSGRTPARFLACLGLLIALFVMHGPSADHMLAMPPEAMTSDQAMAGSTPAGDAAAMSSDAADSADIATAAVEVIAMDMSPCLATLRDTGARLVGPAAVTPVSITAAPVAHSILPSAPLTGGDPPGVDRPSLCIWRI